MRKPIILQSQMNLCSFMMLIKCCYVDEGNPLRSSLDLRVSIPPESYIFGRAIIHNSSINSTSHFLSVSCTFLSFPGHISTFFCFRSLIVGLS